MRGFVFNGSQTNTVKDMKAEILKVAQDLKKGTIDSDKARSLLLCLFGVSGSLPSEIYVTYDRSDGEIFCAFIDKEQCKQEAEESGCGMQTVRLVGKQ